MSDLNRKIAEALGYIVAQIDDIGSEPITLMYLRGEDEFSAVEVPDWAGDLNAAWSLPLPDTATLYLEQRNGRSMARIGHLDWPPTIAYEHENAATALCEAWLEWKAGQGA